jgi:hypothetical protein
MRFVWTLALASCWMSHERQPSDAGHDGGSRDAGAIERDSGPPRCDPGRWTHEIVDTDDGRFGAFALAYAPDGALHVVYAKRDSRAVHALRTASGFVRDDASAQAMVHPGSTLDAVVTERGVHAVYFGRGPDTPAIALWHASHTGAGWGEELVTPWGRLYDRVPAPHVSIDPSGGGVAIAYRGLVDHVVWASATFDGITDEVQAVHAPGSIATGFAPDGRRALAFTDREFLYEAGRIVAAVRSLEVRFGPRVESIELSRRPGDALGDGCGAAGIDLVARPEALDVFFGDPDAEPGDCALRHAAIRDGEAPVIETIDAPAGVVTAARTAGRTHVVAGGTSTTYATRAGGSWSLEALDFEVARARVAASAVEVAVAFTRGEQTSLELATAAICPD